MQLPRNNCHIRANVFVILVAASGSAMNNCRITRVIATSMLMMLLTTDAIAAENPLYRMIEDARKVSDQLIQCVRGDLIQEMQKSGSRRSILVYGYSSPEIAAEYPCDTVIGCALWQVRGAVTSKHPLQGE